MCSCIECIGDQPDGPEEDPEVEWLLVGGPANGQKIVTSRSRETFTLSYDADVGVVKRVEYRLAYYVYEGRRYCIGAPSGADMQQLVEVAGLAPLPD